MKLKAVIQRDERIEVKESCVERSEKSLRL